MRAASLRAKTNFSDLYRYVIRVAKKYLLVGFCWIASVGMAQYMDTLRAAFTGKKSLDIGFDSRNSFVNHNRVGVQSIKLGINFEKKICLGMGYAWLNSRTPVFDTHPYYDADLNKDTFITRRLTFSYFRFNVNYSYYRSRRWEFSIPLQVGVGKLGFKYNYRGIDKQSDEGFCFLYEPEVDVKFKVFRWFGVEGDVGYRFLFKDNKFIKNTFNSPLVSVGVFIVWDELARMAMSNEKVKKRFGPSQW